MRIIPFALALAMVSPFVSRADQPVPDLAEVSLEDLLNVQVTSVSKKEQKLARAAAAIYVITQEDIRRSGMTNIPDLLRTAPGVDVAQIDANTYAISIRGFNDRLANKVLVMIDGRTVYTPTTSGVYWDQQDVPLEDIDRIEIIRGPGGTVWGANAVNGVINIITKAAGQTKGAMVSASGGSQKAARGLAEYGGEIGQNGAYRVFGNYSNTGNLTASDGSRASDGWHMQHLGFRSDWTLSPRDTLTVQGDLMQTVEDQTISVTFSNALPLQGTFSEKVRVEAGDLLERWNRTLKNGSDISLQVYYDRYKRHDEGVTETLNTLDFDFHHHLAVGTRHDVVWGAGYRVTADDHLAGYGKTYVPLALTNNLFSAFVQDEMKVTNSLRFTLGAKVEHNAYTGYEFEPSAQLVWQPTNRQSLWASAAKAIRQPSREEAGLQVDLAIFPVAGGNFGVVKLTGDPNRKPEELRDFEAGYRVQPNRRLSFDIASFSSFYRNLTTTDNEDAFFTTQPAPPHLVLPLVFGNNASAHTYGAEAFAVWNVTHRWKLSPGYTLVHLNVTLNPTSTDTSQKELAANTPQHQMQLRSFLNLTTNLDWDTALYYVGRLRDGGDGAVPAYTRLDTRLAWRIGESVELSVVGQNLLTPTHAEFHNAYEVRRTLVERSVSAKITWHF